MEIEIYVQSAGISQKQDYSWQIITENEQKPIEEPSWIKESKVLLQTETYSIFLGRKNKNLILLVTGMKAKKRKDYRDRTIRNSIALVAPDNEENEQKIRGIAVLALEEKLEDPIDEAINEEEKYGFEVDYEKIKNLIQASLQKGELNRRTEHLMIGKNSIENRQTIAKQLKEDPLPQEPDVLVVVTGIKKEEDLKDAGVWRGLSNLVEKKYLHKYTQHNSAKKFFKSVEDRQGTNAKYIMILIISLSVIGLISLLYFSPFSSTRGQNHSSPTTVVLPAISQSGKYFAIAYPQGKVLVQNTQDKTINTIENNASIKSVAISADGSHIVIGDQTGNVRLWNINSQKEINLQDNTKDDNLKHQKAVLSLDINAHKNNIKIVSGGEDGQVLMWKVNVNDDMPKVSIEKLYP